MYRLIATCLLAFATTYLPAQFTYHDLIPDVAVGKDYIHPWYGNPGFSVTYEHGYAGGGGSGGFTWDAMILNYLGVGQILEGGGSATVLSIGDIIGPGSGSWGTPPGQFYGASIAFQNLSNPPIPPFYCRYAGFRSFSAGDTLYGWLAYEKDTVGGTKVTIKGWAISTVPNTPLVISDNCVVGTGEPHSRDLQVRAFPNPASNLLHVQLPEVRGTVSIRLMDALGRTHWETQRNGETSLEIDVAPYPPGVYLLVVDAGSRRFNQQVILTGRGR